MDPALLTVLKVLTSLLSILLYLSPIPMMRRVHRAKQVGETQLLPLVGMFVNCFSWMLYGFFTDDIFPLSFTCVVGDSLALIYITVFINTTDDRRYASRVCGIALATCLLLSLYAGLAWRGITNQSTDATGTVLGYISVVINCLFYSSPFATMRHVVRTKCAESIPIALVTMGTISNGLWTVYGLADSDLFIIVPNAICVAVGIMQMLLYAKYKPSLLLTEAEILECGDAMVELTTPKQNDDSFGMHSPSFHALRSPLAPIGETNKTEMRV